MGNSLNDSSTIRAHLRQEGEPRISRTFPSLLGSSRRRTTTTAGPAARSRGVEVNVGSTSSSVETGVRLEQKL